VDECASAWYRVVVRLGDECEDRAAAWIAHGLPAPGRRRRHALQAVFKVYDMALYTTRKVGTPEDVLGLPGPKKLQFTALRELSSTELGRLFVKGMSENATREQNVRHMTSSMRLIEIFSSRSKLMPGDSFAMLFVPGQGTQFVVQGQPQGEPVGDAEFFSMVLGIWFGNSPADRLLENALLGRETQTTQP
jgi:hypothetical protein